ncbi:MAG: hypothetical protein N3B21_14040 [Clostridia bacterium]|nr:hypothetical protein [Clostridia bacterium]
MKSVLEFKYDEDHTLNILISEGEGINRTMGVLVFSFLTLPIAIFFTFSVLFNFSSGKLFHMDLSDSIFLISIAVFFDFISGLFIYVWLSSNFTKEKIIIDKRNGKLFYVKWIFFDGKVKEFELNNIKEVKVEAEPGFHRNTNLYRKCYLKYDGYKFRFGILSSISDGGKVVGRINGFIGRI